MVGFSAIDQKQRGRISSVMRAKRQWLARAGCPTLAGPVLPYQLRTTNCCMSPLRRSNRTRLPVL